MNLATLFGLSVLSLAFFMLSFVIQLLVEYKDRIYVNDESWNWLVIGGIAASIFFVFALGVLFRKKWARMGMIIFLLLGLAGFGVLLFFIFSESRSAPIVFLGVTIFGFGSLLSGILFLSNQYVLDHFEDKIISKEESLDILDGDF